MDSYMKNISQGDFKEICEELKEYSSVPAEYFDRFEVKRGLRNRDGSGVMAGLTRVCSVDGYYIDDGERQPIEGKLKYRGIDINDIAR